MYLTVYEAIAGSSPVRSAKSSHARAPVPMGSYESGETCNWLAQHVGVNGRRSSTVEHSGFA